MRRIFWLFAWVCLVGSLGGLTTTLALPTAAPSSVINLRKSAFKAVKPSYADVIGDILEQIVYTDGDSDDEDLENANSLHPSILQLNRNSIDIERQRDHIKWYEQQTYQHSWYPVRNDDQSHSIKHPRHTQYETSIPPGVRLLLWEIKNHWINYSMRVRKEQRQSIREAMFIPTKDGRYLHFALNLRLQYLIQQAKVLCSQPRVSSLVRLKDDQHGRDEEREGDFPLVSRLDREHYIRRQIVMNHGVFEDEHLAMIVGLGAKLPLFPLDQDLIRQRRLKVVEQWEKRRRKNSEKGRRKDTRVPVQQASESREGDPPCSTVTTDRHGKFVHSWKRFAFHQCSHVVKHFLDHIQQATKM